MKLEVIKEILFEQGYEDTIILENPSYETALIGTTDDGRLVYDYEKMVQYLIDSDNMCDEDAREFIDYNTIRALPYMGNKSPLIIYPLIIKK